MLKEKIRRYKNIVEAFLGRRMKDMNNFIIPDKLIHNSFLSSVIFA